MATKIKAAEAAPEVRDEPAGDGPLMDGVAAAVKKMVTRGRERGYVTYDEINAVLPPDQVSSEQIEDTLAMLSEQGINVVESEEPEETAEKPANAKEQAEEEQESESEYSGGN